MPALGHDFASESDLAPWREVALRRGFRVSSALPLIHEGQTLGSLTVYSSEPETFDDEELSILGQLSRDVAYGIFAQRERAARIHADRKFEKAFRLSRDAIILTEKETGRVVEANDAFLALLGYAREEVIGKPSTHFNGLTPERRSALLQRLLADGTLREVELQMRAKSGQTRTVVSYFDVIDLDGVRSARTSPSRPTSTRRCRTCAATPASWSR
jgi:PAS domain S-box-containing protein